MDRVAEFSQTPGDNLLKTVELKDGQLILSNETLSLKKPLLCDLVTYSLLKGNWKVPVSILNVVYSEHMAIPDTIKVDIDKQNHGALRQHPAILLPQLARAMWRGGIADREGRLGREQFAADLDTLARSVYSKESGGQLELAINNLFGVSTLGELENIK